jgi:aspartyl-tRNA synthetase
MQVTPQQTSYRTHTCGELTAKHVSSRTTLSGWVHSRRDHGGIIFIDLRDRYGLTQIVFDPQFSQSAFANADKLRREDCICVSGLVEARADTLKNPKLATGEIEVFIDTLMIFAKAQTPPIEIDDTPANDDLRLQYRYLDLRRTVMQNNLRLRHNVVKSAREFMDSMNFLEVETPLLIKSTPEGARDYVVPSRVHNGSFYALPQSPQLYKQILMLSGCDRYFQVARCLRDEDLRADRQPEHTQFDLEMSFVTQEDVRELVTELYRHIFKTVLHIDLPSQFPALTYAESMAKYGNDKPDMRFDLFLTDVTDIVVKGEFGVFKNVASSGGIIKVLNPTAEFTRTDLEGYISYSQKLGSKGMAWMRVTQQGLESNIAKYFSTDIQKELIERTGAKPGSYLFFIADKPKQCNDILSKIRLKVGDDLGLIDKKAFALCWIVDFPMFEFNTEEKRWDAMHNPFCMPHSDDLDELEQKIPTARAQQYDLVMNGYEMGSGAIRISNPDVQKKVFELIGITPELAQEKFGFLLEAYKYGAPMHGGMGLGVDRLCALMIGTGDIREVIAFPKNKAAQCPMDQSPSPIDKKQLDELGIHLVEKKKPEQKVEQKIESNSQPKVESAVR